MIKKVDVGAFRDSYEVACKINEVIDAINALKSGSQPPQADNNARAKPCADCGDESCCWHGEDMSGWTRVRDCFKERTESPVA